MSLPPFCRPVTACQPCPPPPCVQFCIPPPPCYYPKCSPCLPPCSLVPPCYPQPCPQVTLCQRPCTPYPCQPAPCYPTPPCKPCTPCHPASCCPPPHCNPCSPKPGCCGGKSVGCCSGGPKPIVCIQRQAQIVFGICRTGAGSGGCPKKLCAPAAKPGFNDQQASYNNCNFYLTEIPPALRAMFGLNTNSNENDECTEEDTTTVCTEETEESKSVAASRDDEDDWEEDGECEGQQMPQGSPWGACFPGFMNPCCFPFYPFGMCEQNMCGQNMCGMGGGKGGGWGQGNGNGGSGGPGYNGRYGPGNGGQGNNGGWGHGNRGREPEYGESRGRGEPGYNGGGGQGNDRNGGSENGGRPGYNGGGGQGNDRNGGSENGGRPGYNGGGNTRNTSSQRVRGKQTQVLTCDERSTRGATSRSTGFRPYHYSHEELTKKSSEYIPVASSKSNLKTMNSTPSLARFEPAPVDDDKELLIPIYKTTTQTRLQIVERENQPSEVLVVQRPVQIVTGYQPQLDTQNSRVNLHIVNEDSTNTNKRKRKKRSRQPRTQICLTPHSRRLHRLCSFTNGRKRRLSQIHKPMFHLREPACPIRETLASILRKKPPARCNSDNMNLRRIPPFHDFCMTNNCPETNRYPLLTKDLIQPEHCKEDKDKGIDENENQNEKNTQTVQTRGAKRKQHHR